MVEQMDTAIGRLLAALRAGGRERDTIVIFTADHGPLAPSEMRKPLRGAKADLYEAGLRVPLLVRWPDQFACGQVCAQIVSGADVFPTLLAACGATPAVTDGVDLSLLLRGSQQPLPRDALHWHYPHYHHLGLGPCGAIRTGDYKLVEWFGLQPRQELYNLAADPGEENDLAQRDGPRRDELARRLREWRHAVGAQDMTPNPAYDSARPTRVTAPAGDAMPVQKT
jgi:arylsulfatase A